MEPTASRPLTGSEASHPPDSGKCNICLESLDDRAEFNSRTVKSLTPCGHLYLRECLNMNMTYDRRCPSCRSEINPENIVAFPLTINLHEAVKKESLPAVKRLINKFPVDALNEQGETALMLAVRKGNLEIVKTLIEHGANFLVPVNINEKGTISDWAVKNIELSFIYKLIDEKIINVDQLTQDNISTLCRRAAGPFIFDILAKNGVDLNLIDGNGETALHVVIREGGDKQSIIKLTDLGVKVNAINSEGETALHLAAARPFSWYVLDALIKAGANVNARANDGSTPLHRAAQNGSGLNVSELINRGARQETLNHDRKTALQLAAENNKAETVYTFLSRGGDYATCTESGDMPFDLFPPDRLLSVFKREDAQPFIFNRDFKPDRPCSRDGSTLLSYAVSSEDTVVINKLLECSASTDNLTPEQKETLSMLTLGNVFRNLGINSD